MPLGRTALRPALQPCAESLVSRLRGSPAKCPVCRLSTRSHPLHSTSRVSLEQPRSDHVARIDYFGPGGIVDQRVRAPPFREYASLQERVNPTVPLNLPALLSTLSEMSARGQTPTAEAYLALLRAAAEYSNARGGRGGEATERRAREEGLGQGEGHDVWAEHGQVGLGWKVAWCAWRDAWEGGVDLGIVGFDLLLQAAQPHPEITAALLAQLPHLPTLSATLSPTTYAALLSGPLAMRALPRVLALTTEMRRRHIPPATAGLRRVVELALEWGCPRLALEMAEHAEQTAVRGVEQGVWTDILRCSAESYYLEGVQKTWERVVEQQGFVPEEGLILLVLNTAGRHGDPDLATRALARLARLEVEPREHHLAPLLDAFCGAGKLADAFEVLDLLRHTAEIAPNLKTAEPLVRCMGTTGIVDEAFFTLGKIKETGKRIDVVAFNSVIAACERLGDLGRALAVYRDAPALAVRPDVDTYNCLLGICVANGAKEQGDIVLREMRAAKPTVRLDATTYRHLIHLALTQKTYDEAFLYLEQMKEANHRPPVEVYEDLVLKCVSNGDARWKTVLQEMRNGGYTVSPHLIKTVQVRAGIIPPPEKKFTPKVPTYQVRRRVQGKSQRAER